MTMMSLRNITRTSRNAARLTLSHNLKICSNQSTVASMLEDEEDIPIDKALPYEQIPGPYALPIIGSLYKYFPGGGYKADSLLEARTKLYKKYGPIVKEHLTAKNVFTHLFDVKDVQKLIRNEGKYPDRPITEMFAGLCKEMGVPPIMSAESGEEWFRLRSSVQKDMMQPRTIGVYLPANEEVAFDLAEMLGTMRDEKNEVPDLEKYLQRYSIEAVGLICFNQRLGALDQDLQKDSDAQIIIQSSERAFSLMLKFLYTYDLVQKGFYKKKWNMFVQANKDIFNITEKLMDKNKDKGGTGTILHVLLQNPNLKKHDRINIMTSLLRAGVESTSYTIAFVLYQLAKYPDVQERLYQEICTELSDNQSMNYEIYSHKLKYTKAVFKESNRLMPAAVNSILRTLPKDLVLSGYRLPAGSQVMVQNGVMGRLPQYFENPETFSPERWLTDDRDLNKLAAFIVLPFGYGARSCIGRRFAEQELILAVVKILQKYKIEYHHEDVRIKNNVFQHTDKPLRLTFIDRK